MSLVWPAFADPVAFDYRGICDASGAVALDSDHFAVADDETNTLWIYRRGEPDIVDRLDLSESLKTKPTKEVDLEGAARVGGRIYWIASHSKDKKKRRRFFATDIVAGAPPTLQKPPKYSNDLLKEMIAAPGLAAYDLEDAAARNDPEQEGALNIEGLAATPDGDLLIGFRNPIPKGKALIVPLKNPNKVLKGEKARFGAPVELDLGGKGIRSIERVGADDLAGYLIVAGPYNDDGSFALFRWSGASDATPQQIDAATLLTDLHPEALFAVPGTNEVQILSDDGGVMVDGTECKNLEGANEAKKGFRSQVLTLN
ncbi:MAG TPA: DUF3616 domain-containing protein [Methyloceanibacter sp.]|nr:DUF3616 domain-containing protein [Methyloceanibacter sp.]